MIADSRKEQVEVKTVAYSCPTQRGYLENRLNNFFVNMSNAILIRKIFLLNTITMIIDMYYFLCIHALMLTMYDYVVLRIYTVTAG